jgi:hypothetical protein
MASDASISERVTILETQMGDSQSGVLGEVRGLKRDMRSMELRMYTVGSLLAAIGYGLSKLT